MATQQIPLDVIIDILVLLPVKTLIRFKSVCKEWCNLIISSLFIKHHLNKSRESNSLHNRALFYIHKGRLHVADLYHPFKLTKFNWPYNIVTENTDYLGIVDSCNGLVCFIVTESLPSLKVKCFLICNPSTREFKQIRPSLENCCQRTRNLYGFGYDSKHDDYKIVGHCKRHGDMCIYSLKADLWRCASPTHTTHTWYISGLVFVNNMLHCLVSSDNKDCRIARFDLSSEKWGDALIFPVQVKMFFIRRLQLGVLDGSIYILLNGSRGFTDVWMMEEYGKEDTWSVKFHLSETVRAHNLVALSKDETPRLLIERGEDGFSDLHELAWYGQQHHRVVASGLKPLPGNSSSAQICIASLVSIPGRSLIKMQ